MIIIFISLIFVIVSLNFFTLNMQIQGLNREIVNTPIQLISRCVIYYNEEIYFDNQGLESTLDDYYYEKISKYTDDFYITYYYFNADRQTYCTDRYCKSVEVSITCSLINHYEFSRTMYYQTMGGIYG